MLVLLGSLVPMGGEQQSPGRLQPAIANRPTADHITAAVGGKGAAIADRRRAHRIRARLVGAARRIPGLARVPARRPLLGLGAGLGYPHLGSPPLSRRVGPPSAARRRSSICRRNRARRRAPAL